MRVLIATRLGQGQRKNDFMNAKEGELVTLPGVTCDGEKVDGVCGCKRSFVGLQSHQATTTFQIADRPDLTPALFLAALQKSFREAGWGKHFSDAEIWKMIVSDAKQLISFAQVAPVGTVLECRGNRLAIRKVAQADQAVRS